jgi:hypothetical protein
MEFPLLAGVDGKEPPTRLLLASNEEEERLARASLLAVCSMGVEEALLIRRIMLTLLSCCGSKLAMASWRQA